MKTPSLWQKLNPFKRFVRKPPQESQQTTYDEAIGPREKEASVYHKKKGHRKKRKKRKRMENKSRAINYRKAK